MSRNRGPHPNDQKLFSGVAVDNLHAAVRELSWLLSRSYPRSSSLELVGNRYRLTKRQRIAVGRASCSDQERESRLGKMVANSARIAVDGFNLLTTVEAGLSHGLILICRDHAWRDMASMHGTYREVETTNLAMERIGSATSGCMLHWYLDKPVSNSGRLRAKLLDFAKTSGLDWTVELVPDPDPILKKSECCVASSDSAILDEVTSWINLAELALLDRPLWLIDFTKHFQADSSLED